MTEGTEDRGRTATSPAEIPPAGWRDILVRVAKHIARDNINLIAAGLALYGLLSIFPGLTATVSVYGLFDNPNNLVRQMSRLVQHMPPGVWQLLQSQLQDMASHGRSELSATAGIAILMAIWSARSGMSSLMSATNVAYQRREKRSFIWQIVLSLLLTIGAVVGFLLIVALVVGVPAFLALFGQAPWVKVAGNVASYIVLWGVAVLGLAIIYRVAPSRRPARWRWITWGSAIAATLWVLTTVLFALYVKTLASYQKTYGPLGDVVVLLLWFYISSFLILLGAEINSEAERQTLCDTTTGGEHDGEESPARRRDAFAASTAG